MPPYPFFQPAIREFRADPEAFIFKNSELGSIDEINSTDELIRTIAFSLENQMKKNVTAQGSLDRSPGTDPEHPRSGFVGMFDGRMVRNTGNLRASISAVKVS